MGTETKSRPPRALWISLAAAVLSAAVFVWAVLFEYLMNPQGIYLRSTLKFYAGTVNLLFILPTAVFVSLLIFLVYLRKKRLQGKGVITGLIIFGSAVYGMFFLWAALTTLVLGAVNIMRGDYVGENGWLMEWHGPWGEAEGAWYTYFEEYNWLWKKEYYATEDSVRQEMEDRYGTQITPVGTTAGQEGWGIYTFAAEGDPSFAFRVQPSDQRDFKEDFVQACADTLMETVMEEAYPRRTWSIAYADQGQGPGGESSRFETGFVIECADLDDARVCAEIVAHLAEEALKSDYIADYGALIVVRCAGVEKWAADAAFPVGKNRLGDRTGYVWEGDRYTDWSLVYARLLDNYTWNPASGQGDAQENTIDLESSAFYVEGAYRFLYDALFADAGYPYKPAYSAKGSFYAYLSESTGTLESVGERMNTLETVVYDRESKNGKCHLFVHYREYYEIGADAPYSTEIVDMYAVEMATGRVFVSGRHAWADLGSQEYQEAAGEP